MAFYLEAGLKYDILEKISGMPFIGNSENLALVKKVKKARNMAFNLGESMSHFKLNIWLYDSAKLQEIIKLMSPRDK